MIRYSGEDAKVHEVGQEVDQKHWACELLPLGIQEPVHGLHLEHLVAFLDRRGGVFSGEKTSAAPTEAHRCRDSQGCRCRTPVSPTLSCPRRSPERPGRTGSRWRARKPTRWTCGIDVWWDSRGTPVWGCVKKAVDERRRTALNLSQQLDCKGFNSEIS